MKWHSKLFAPVLIVLVAAIIYGPSVSHGFVLDDEDAIVSNRFVQQGFAGLGDIWTTEYRAGFSSEQGSLYRPLALSLFAMQWALSPKDPMPGHAVNFLLFVLCSLMVFLLVKRLAPSQPRWVSLLAVLLFVVHPIHAEVVANIKSADELLSALFSLITIWLVAGPARGSWLNRALALASFFLALCSKEGSVMVLGMIPLTVLLTKDRKWMDALRESLWFLVLVVIYFFLRLQALGSFLGEEEIPELDNMLVALDGADRFFTTVGIAGMYLAKLIWPATLSHDYSLHQIEVMHAGSGWFWIGLTGWIMLFFLIVRFRSRQPLIEWSGAFLLITFVLYSNVFFLIGTHFGERLLFLPSIGFCLLIAFLLYDLSTRHTERKWRLAALTIIGLILGIGAWKTMDRTSDWKSELALYRADVVSAPESTRTHYRLGRVLNKQALSASNETRRRSLFKEAASELQTAVSIYPEFSDAHAELGLAYEHLEAFDRAETHYDRALEIHPGHQSTLNNKGSLLFKQGKPADALPYFQKAFRLSPSFDGAAANIGMCYGTLEQFDSAMFWFDEAIRLAPNNARHVFFKALTYQNMGDTATAMEWLEKAQNIDPNIGR